MSQYVFRQDVLPLNLNKQSDRRPGMDPEGGAERKVSVHY